MPISVARDGNSKHDIKHRERWPRQEPEPCITYLEFVPQGRQQNRKNLPIDKIEHVNDGQHDQRIATRAC